MEKILGFQGRYQITLKVENFKMSPTSYVWSSGPNPFSGHPTLAGHLRYGNLHFGHIKRGLTPKLSLGAFS